MNSGLATNVPWRHLRGWRADGKTVALATDEALTICGISHLAERRPADLSTGHRRLVELARCIAGGFRLILFGEPTSGLDKQEIAHFRQILRSLCEDKGTGTLIVEHDMALVMGIWDYIYVLGRPIFEGRSAEVAAGPSVRPAYLGSEDVEAALEGGSLMLEMQNVVAGYSGAVLFGGIDLTVPDASVVALLGANDAGKTTLPRVANGLLCPSQGRLVVDGADASTDSPSQLVAKGICDVPEGRGVFQGLTVRGNLVLQAINGDGSQAIERAVVTFPRLRERLTQVAATITGGEQQMLALARTYDQQPSLILLDEVSLGLAPKIVDEIFQFLDLLRAQGASLLLVEQCLAGTRRRRRRLRPQPRRSRRLRRAVRARGRRSLRAACRCRRPTLTTHIELQARRATMQTSSTTALPQKVDDRHFRDVLGHLPTGVTAITGRQENGNPGGLVVGTFASVSLNPPLVSFLVAETSTSWPQIRHAGRFSASVLSDDQEHVGRALASKGTAKFTDIAWTPSPVNDAPLITGAHAWIDCDVDREFVLGDHTLVVGRVLELATPGSAAPLVFYRGRYHRVTAKEEVS